MLHPYTASSRDIDSSLHTSAPSLVSRSWLSTPIDIYLMEQSQPRQLASHCERALPSDQATARTTPQLCVPLTQIFTHFKSSRGCTYTICCHLVNAPICSAHVNDHYGMLICSRSWASLQITSGFPISAFTSFAFNAQ